MPLPPSPSPPRRPSLPRSGAEVVPFPARTAEADQDRLCRTLDGLQAALAAQAEAVAAWRAELAALQEGVGRLHASLRRYQTHLGALDLGVARLGEEAHALHRHAAAMEGPASA